MRSGHTVWHLIMLTDCCNHTDKSQTLNNVMLSNHPVGHVSSFLPLPISWDKDLSVLFFIISSDPWQNLYFFFLQGVLVIPELTHFATLSCFSLSCQVPLKPRNMPGFNCKFYLFPWRRTAVEAAHATLWFHPLKITNRVSVDWLWFATKQQHLCGSLLFAALSIKRARHKPNL